MTPTLTRSPAPLREVLYEFSLAKDVPDVELVEGFARRYPEHAAAITEFAIELLIDKLQPGKEEASVVAATAKVSPEVSRAMSRFQNKLYETAAGRAAASSMAMPAAPVNPFAGLTREDFRQVARQLNVNAVFLCKLRDRQIDPNTMSVGFKRHIAEGVHASLDVMAAHLSAPAQITGQQPQYYKSEGTPVAGQQQSFEEAVRNSGLTEEQQRYLLSL